jgi:TetR/AcrR family transcriptional regulator, transcriptional repressor for nem operon
MGKAQKTRQFIIEKASVIFNQRGIAGTSISDIMEATKLAKGGIYGNFTTKEQISEEAFDYMVDNVKKVLQAVVSEKLTAKDKLLAILDFYLDYALDPVMTGGCPILNFGVEVDDTNPNIKIKIQEAISYFQGGIKKIVIMGKEAGEFMQNWDEEGFSINMFASIEGGILITRIMDNNYQMKMIIDNLKQIILKHTS